jgi:hypothetical protein
MLDIKGANKKEVAYLRGKAAVWAQHIGRGLIRPKIMADRLSI